jgi:type IV pilus assembly protein PilQ
MRVTAAVVFLLVAGTLAAQSRTAPQAREKPGPGRRPRLQSAPKAVSRDSRWLGEAISLDLKDADLRDVLHTFSQLTGLNIVVDPEVKGSVTVRLHDVPWDQALDLILRTNGFGDVLEGNVLRVGLPSKL